MKMRPELSARIEANSDIERLKAWRFRCALLAIAFSISTKLMPFGSVMWLTKGYGHDFATPIFVFMLTRSHFSSAQKCAVVTLIFFLLSEAFQFFQF